jgi:hypothetical protein
VFPAAVLACAKAVACELPATRGVPLSRWSLGELRQELIATGLVDDISTTTLWRWLDADAIKPWQHRSWIFPRDPEFAAKAGVVLDLYEGGFAGRALGADEFVISADEKTSIQARCRCHPTLPVGRARRLRVEHEYERRGALAGFWRRLAVAFWWWSGPAPTRQASSAAPHAWSPPLGSSRSDASSPKS